MYILIGSMAGIILLLGFILWRYQRQVKDICRRLRFLKEYDSNMLITKEMEWGGIGELSDTLNDILMKRKEERKRYIKKEREISDTYTNLSHDIRTPLTSLDGYVQLLAGSETEEERKRYLGVVQERIESLKEMLEELFTYTKLQNESYELEKERLNVNQILKETVFSYYDSWTKAGIEPGFDIEETPLWIRGNRQALRRVMQNVIKNGLDHGEKKIRIAMKPEGGKVVLTFANQAANAGNIDVEQVFERFYKADEARSKNSTGLGLAIAKEFVKKMDGEIYAKTDEEWFSVVIVFDLLSFENRT